MNTTEVKKVHKCKHTNKEVCVRACIREHNRLVQMNQRFDQIRTLLNISPKTSKAKTLTEASRYIKMLLYVLDPPAGVDTDGNIPNRVAQETDALETADELEQQYTLNENFRAILPEEMQTLSIPTLVKKMPYLTMLLGLTTTQMQTTDDSHDDDVVPANGSNSPRKPMQLDVDGFVGEYSEQPAAVEEVNEQPPDVQNNNSLTQKPSSFSSIHQKLYLLFKNKLNPKCENMRFEPITNEQFQAYFITNCDKDVGKRLPCCMSLIKRIRSSPTEDPLSCAVQELEPMGVDFPVENMEVEPPISQQPDGFLIINGEEDVDIVFNSIRSSQIDDPLSDVVEELQPMEVDFPHRHTDQNMEIDPPISEQPEGFMITNDEEDVEILPNSIRPSSTEDPLPGDVQKLQPMEVDFPHRHTDQNMEVEPPISEQPEGFMTTNGEEDVEILPNSIRPFSIEHPFIGVVQESEPMDYLLNGTTELERNLGEFRDEWFRHNILENDPSDQDFQDLLVYMDTDGMDKNGIFFEQF